MQNEKVKIYKGLKGEEIFLKEGEERTVVVLGGGKLKVRLVGEGAKAKVLGVIIARGGGMSELAVEIVHEAPKTKAEILLRGVVFDGARADIRGWVRINKGATLAEDSLREDLLLVGEQAKGEAYPYLEIEENDVAAKHAATVGQIDKEQLFYLMSRGVDEAAAKELLVQGFFEPILEAIPVSNRDKIERELRKKLRGGNINA